MSSDNQKKYYKSKVKMKKKSLKAMVKMRKKALKVSILNSASK